MLHKYIDNPIGQCDLKFASDNSTGEFEGYGSVWDKTDQSGDTIKKGTFADSIKARMPKMFINHNHMDIPAGDWLSAKEDDVGLFLKGKVDLNHRDGPSLLSAMKRKAMEGLSTGTLRKTLKYDRKEDGGRIITWADLREVSVVTFPMEENAMVLAVKSEIELITDLKSAEIFLRDSGVFSRTTATAFVSQLKGLCQSESDAELKEQITELKSRLAGKIATDQLTEMFNKYSLTNLLRN